MDFGFWVGFFLNSSVEQELDLFIQRPIFHLPLALDRSLSLQFFRHADDRADFFSGGVSLKDLVSDGGIEEFERQARQLLDKQITPLKLLRPKMQPAPSGQEQMVEWICKPNSRIARMTVTNRLGVAGIRTGHVVNGPV